MSSLDNIKIKLTNFSISEKYIIINCAVFAIIAIVNALYFLFADNHLRFFQDFFALPADIGVLITRPWTLFTYFFTHFSFRHLFSNIIALFFFGRIFLIFYNSKQFLKHYIFGGLFAGLIFIISYNLFPALIEKKAILVGASASIFSVLFGATATSPYYNFNLLGIFKIPLWVISSLYTLLFISSLPYANSGGELAHLGGAFFGYFYALELKKGKDIGSGFERMMDTIASWFKPKSNLKTVHRRQGRSKTKMAGKTKQEFDTYNKQKKIDLILDKISKSGYESLTAEEKEFLFRAGK
ncbi:rhomboid family intramembrane serine protease [Winogradskyella sp. SYSU M77433]|uniref:rhomboid family intramembrane serine protease n=1 Tax=Winogradskyella sp. SYSU M77433 TaxID=3042722 RepID=UPI002480B59E|nr:rhomboid family intramembrane serine protease [Winogradskyella sp. SYSU M77433]MDH7912953.1 rhomboid family intramembrane serine protease [Winogradskyella sp. SYSU M77433]